MTPTSLPHHPSLLRFPGWQCPRGSWVPPAAGCVAFCSQASLGPTEPWHPLTTCKAPCLSRAPPDSLGQPAYTGQGLALARLLVLPSGRGSWKSVEVAPCGDKPHHPVSPTCAQGRELYISQLTTGTCVLHTGPASDSVRSDKGTMTETLIPCSPWLGRTCPLSASMVCCLTLPPPCPGVGL